ncbi:disease resistance protein RGA2-like [Gossypium australe]|uniref:Disease resistance protein RGA2-like n=1 Tax=Gossypium australe TaxID=47621 RepID=A0A5B6WDW2_9ROSI|nr:disease resistance protein RGA2-like [Gossypium australe]
MYFDAARSSTKAEYHVVGSALAKMTWQALHRSPIFTRENYHVWVVKMKIYLQTFDLWKVVNA